MEVSQEASHQEDQDTNKLESVTNLQRGLMLTHNCCTKLRKFCSNKKTSEEVAVMEVSQAAVMVDTPAVVMESHLHMAHHKSQPNMAHLDIPQDALLELNSDKLFRDTKLLNT